MLVGPVEVVPPLLDRGPPDLDAGNGLTADGHYEVKYGKVGDLHVVAAGNEFDWIKAHFVGGPATCAKQ